MKKRNEIIAEAIESALYGYEIRNGKLFGWDEEIENWRILEFKEWPGVWQVSKYFDRRKKYETCQMIFNGNEIVYVYGTQLGAI